jgi:hypothetical protein
LLPISFLEVRRRSCIPGRSLADISLGISIPSSSLGDPCIAHLKNQTSIYKSRYRYYDSQNKS